MQNELLASSPAAVAQLLATKALSGHRKLSSRARTALEIFVREQIGESGNPELFAPLFALGERDLHPTEEEYLSTALLVHAGVLPVSSISGARPAVLRLAHSHSKVLECQPSAWSDISEKVLDNLDGTVLLWPHSGLFADILPVAV